MGHNQRDAELIETKALPAANANAACDPIDTGALSVAGKRAGAARLEDKEFRLTVPATPDLVEAKTIIYSIETDDDSAMGSVTVVNANLITITGAGAAAGGVAVDERFKLPSDAERYVAVRAAVLDAGGDNTGVDFTLTLHT